MAPSVRSRPRRSLCPVVSLQAATLLYVLTGLVAACADEEAQEGTAASEDEPRVLRPRPEDEPAWTRETLAAEGMGLQLRLAIVDDEPALAYFAITPTEEICASIDGMPEGSRYGLYYRARSGSWSEPVQVADPFELGAPTGLDLAVDPAGNPVIAARAGDPLPAIRYCGAHDLALYRPSGGGWQSEVLVSSSGEAATGEPGSDYGDVVGHWPALAFDPASGDAAVAYKDVHSGSIQSDDRRRADLEISLRGAGGGGSTEPIDFGRGAGEYIQVAFDGQGRPVVVYYLAVESQVDDSQLGVWVARRSADGMWARVRLFAGASVQGPGLSVSPVDGSVHVVWFDADDGLPQHAWLPEGDAFGVVGEGGWSSEGFGNRGFDEGYDLSLTHAPDGRLAASYYRCVQAPRGAGGCDGDDDALVFAWRDSTSGEWTTEQVDPGEGVAGCGRYTSLAFDSSGRAWLGYQCAVVLEDGASVAQQLRVARREPLP